MTIRDISDDSNDRSETRALRFLAALDLMELGIELKRQQIQRQSPALTSTEVDQELQLWLQTRR